MQIGWGELQRDDPLLAIVHSLEEILSHGVQKKQHTISRSSTEAEYRVMANTTAELTWLAFILKDPRITLSSPLICYCNSLSALHMTVISVFHARS
jgi:hypothetical protein